MPTLPVIYGTALYALDNRAHLRAGEVSQSHHIMTRVLMGFVTDYISTLWCRRFWPSLDSDRATAWSHCLRNGKY